MDNSDDLLKRLQEHPDDPEVQRAITRLAWEAFHDPWETPPTAKPECTLLDQLGNASVEMVQGLPEDDEDEDEPSDPPTKEVEGLLTRALDELGLKYSETKSGRVLVPYGYHEPSDREAWVTLRLVPGDRPLLVWAMRCDKRVPTAKLPLAYRICSAWATEKRWPRAFVERPTERPSDAEPEPGVPRASARLELDYHLPLADGVSPQGLKRILTLLISSGWEFWTFAHTQHGL